MLYQGKAKAVSFLSVGAVCRFTIVGQQLLYLIDIILPISFLGMGALFIFFAFLVVTQAVCPRRSRIHRKLNGRLENIFHQFDY